MSAILKNVCLIPSPSGSNWPRMRVLKVTDRSHTKIASDTTSRSIVLRQWSAARRYQHAAGVAWDRSTPSSCNIACSVEQSAVRLLLQLQSPCFAQGSPALVDSAPCQTHAASLRPRYAAPYRLELPPITAACVSLAKQR
jgi:hypothetical protein